LSLITRVKFPKKSNHLNSKHNLPWSLTSKALKSILTPFCPTCRLTSITVRFTLKLKKKIIIKF